MGLFEAILITATFLCSLVAGFLFAFAVVVFPGIQPLSDKEFIRAFQEMDLIIQNNQPIFMIVWLGSVLAIITSGILGFWHLNGTDLGLIVAAALLYLLGVQLPTIVVNVPLNLKLQSMDVDEADKKEHKEARENFEMRWTRSNSIRTFFSMLISLILIILLFRL